MPYGASLHTDSTIAQIESQENNDPIEQPVVQIINENDGAEEDVPNYEAMKSSIGSSRRKKNYGFFFKRKISKVSEITKLVFETLKAIRQQNEQQQRINQKQQKINEQP